MGKIINLSEFNNYRKSLSEIKIDEDVLSFENKEGDLVVMRPSEAKDVIREFFVHELDLYLDDIVINYKMKANTDITLKLEIFENRLNGFIEDKFNQITEKVMERIITRLVEVEVNKRVDEKLKKIKDRL
jgi:hypothetical protein